MINPPEQRPKIMNMIDALAQNSGHPSNTAITTPEPLKRVLQAGAEQNAERPGTVLGR
jgi:hypothetical protein